MSTKSREYLYGHSIRYSAEKAKLARQEADKLACEAWNMRMLGYKGPAQPSPTLGDALNAGFGYLEVRCLGCDTHQTVALDIVRRLKATPVHELERYMRLQGLLAGARLSVQAQPPCRAAAEQDFSQRSALDVVAGREVGRTRYAPITLRLGSFRCSEVIVPDQLRDAGNCISCRSICGGYPKPNLCSAGWPNANPFVDEHSEVDRWSLCQLCCRTNKPDRLHDRIARQPE